MIIQINISLPNLFWIFEFTWDFFFKTQILFKKNVFKHYETCQMSMIAFEKHFILDNILLYIVLYVQCPYIKLQTNYMK